eukprot:g34205.t1
MHVETEGPTWNPPDLLSPTDLPSPTMEPPDSKQSIRHRTPDKANNARRREDGPSSIQIATIFISTYLGYVAMYVARKPVSIMKWRLQKEGVPLSLMSWMDTAWMFSYALGKFIVGPLVDKVHPMFIFSTGGLLAAVACAAYKPGVPILPAVLLWSLNGLGQSAGFLAGIRWLTPIVPSSHRSLVMSLWETSQNIGGMLGGAFLGHASSTRQAFLLPGLSLGVCSIWVMAVGYLGTSHRQQSKKTDCSEDEQSHEDEQKMGESIWSPLQVPGVGFAASAYACVRSTRYLLMFWLPFHFSEMHALGTEAAGLASTCFDVAGVVGTVLAGRVHDLKLGRLSDPRTLSACCLVPGALLLLYLDLHPTPMSVTTSILSLSLVAAGAEIADYLLVGPTALEISTHSGHGARYMGRVSGLISGLAALVSAFMQALALEIVGPVQLVKLIVLMQSGGVLFTCLSVSQGGTTRTKQV